MQERVMEQLNCSSFIKQTLALGLGEAPAKPGLIYKYGGVIEGSPMSWLNRNSCVVMFILFLFWQLVEANVRNVSSIVCYGAVYFGMVMLDALGQMVISCAGHSMCPHLACLASSVSSALGVAFHSSLGWCRVSLSSHSMIQRRRNPGLLPLSLYL